MALLLSIHSDIMILRILFTLGFVLVIDIYAYQAFKTVFRSTATPWIYWGITLVYLILGSKTRNSPQNDKQTLKGLPTDVQILVEVRLVSLKV